MFGPSKKELREEIKNLKESNEQLADEKAKVQEQFHDVGKTLSNELRTRGFDVPAGHNFLNRMANKLKDLLDKEEKKTSKIHQELTGFIKDRYPKFKVTLGEGATLDMIQQLQRAYEQCEENGEEAHKILDEAGVDKEVRKSFSREKKTLTVLERMEKMKDEHEDLTIKFNTLEKTKGSMEKEKREKEHAQKRLEEVQNELEQAKERVKYLEGCREPYVKVGDIVKRKEVDPSFRSGCLVLSVSRDKGRVKVYDYGNDHIGFFDLMDVFVSQEASYEQKT